MISATQLMLFGYFICLKIKVKKNPSQSRFDKDFANAVLGFVISMQ